MFFERPQHWYGQWAGAIRSHVHVVTSLRSAMDLALRRREKIGEGAELQFGLQFISHHFNTYHLLLGGARTRANDGQDVTFLR